MALSLIVRTWWQKDYALLVGIGTFATIFSQAMPVLPGLPA